MTVKTNSAGAADLPVIEVKNLTKEYRLGVVESMRGMARRLLGHPVVERQRFKALNDVTFSVGRGEVVGIIGHNGAGKSTLLKHLSNITAPTSGSVTVRGRVAPLIEVGAGLIGDMTGRENIYLNATILGLSRQEIDSRIDEIIEFSELHRFIDTPIKRYSSGMQVRLGFSIAVSVSSDLMLIDEVLAVGDVAFQNKCIDKLSQQLHERGTTAVIVGHNIRQLERVCTRMIYLSHGKVEIDSTTAEAAAAYFSAAVQGGRFSDPTGKVLGIVSDESDGSVTVRSLSAQKRNGGNLETNEALEFRVEFSVLKELDQPEIVFGLHTVDMVHLISVSNIANVNRPSYGVGEHCVKVCIERNPLRSGVFMIRFGILGKFRQIHWYGESIREVKIESGHVVEAHLPASGLLYTESNWMY